MSNFSIEENGVKFPLFADFLNEMEKEGKIQFGEDFEIDPETSLGQILEIFCYMLENQSKQLQSVYSQMFLFNKKGSVLSAYATNFGTERKKGQKAYGNIVLEGVAGYIVSKGFQVRNKKGKLYQTVSNVLINEQGKATVQIEALEIGDDYNTDINTVVEKATGDENIFKVYNLEKIEKGNYLENDIELRERIQKMFLAENDADVNGIKSSLSELPQVEECLVIENSTNVFDTETGLNPGEIRVIIKGLVDEEVAYKLLNCKSAGIKTVGNVEFLLTTNSEQKTKIRLQSARRVDFEIKVSNLEYTNQDNKIEKNEIINSVLNETKKFKLGSYINYEKILSAVYKNDKQKEGIVEIRRKGDNMWLKEDIFIGNDEYSYITNEDIEVIL